MMRIRAVMTSRAALVKGVQQNSKINSSIPFAAASSTRVAQKPLTTNRIVQGGDSVRGYTVATKPLTTWVVEGGDSVRGYTVASNPLTIRIEGGDSVRGYTTLPIPINNSQFLSRCGKTTCVPPGRRCLCSRSDDDDGDDQMQSAR